MKVAKKKAKDKNVFFYFGKIFIYCNAHMYPKIEGLNGTKNFSGFSYEICLAYIDTIEYPDKLFFSKFSKEFQCNSAGVWPALVN